MAVRQLRAEPVGDVRGEHGEGPAWDARAGHLLWVDMLAGGLHRATPDGSDDVTEYDQPVCVAVPRVGGGTGAGARRRPLARGTRRRAAPPLCAAPAGASRSDPDERRQVRPGGPAVGGFDGVRLAARRRVAVPARCRPTPSTRCCRRSRSRTVWPGRRTERRCTTSTRRPDGSMPSTRTRRPARSADRRPAVDVPKRRGQPDGMTIDDEGCLWVALLAAARPSTATRPTAGWTPSSSCRAAQVTSCAFGGVGLDELYITTSGLGSVRRGRCRPAARRPPVPDPAGRDRSCRRRLRRLSRPPCSSPRFGRRSSARRGATSSSSSSRPTRARRGRRGPAAEQDRLVRRGRRRAGRPVCHRLRSVRRRTAGAGRSSGSSTGDRASIGQSALAAFDIASLGPDRPAPRRAGLEAPRRAVPRARAGVRQRLVPDGLRAGARSRRSPRPSSLAATGR